MTADHQAFPGLLRFAWMFFMQPISLHRRLASLRVNPELRPWGLCRSANPFDRLYLLRSSVILFGMMPLATAMVAGALSLFGLPVSWGGVAGGVAFGVAFGVAAGVAFGVATGVAGGVAVGVPSGVPVRVAVGVAIGVAFGVAADVAGGVDFGVAGDLAFLRLPVFCLELVAQAALYLCKGSARLRCLRFSPVLYHELSYFPLPFLARHIETAAAEDPALARRVLEACAIAPGQRRTGRVALARLQARELESLGRGGQFAPIGELQGLWLPGVAGADGLLLGFREAARYLAAAVGASIPYHRIEHLKRAEQALNAIQNQLLASKSDLARPLAGTLAAWRPIIARLRREAEASAAHAIANPFRAGEPLTPEQGREVFRGRENLIEQLEALLADPEHSASVVLLGPRRCGKTSLLQMLPALLPDAQCIFFDLQDNPASSPTAFFRALARRAQEQAQRDRRVTIPPLPDRPPLEAAGEWLSRLEALPGDHRILIAIDEFERLEELFPGDHRELLQLMGLFRATIQHRRRVRLLVAGAAPFDELDRIWNDHFINTRELRLTHLDEPTALGLLTRPIEAFPPEAIPPAVAGAIHARTGGQPYLLQLYGSLLVTRLNSQERRESKPEDVPAVEEDALRQAAAYFRNTWDDAPEHARAALLALARNERPDLPPSTRRWLERRCLLAPDDSLQIPVLARWLREEVLG